LASGLIGNSNGEGRMFISLSLWILYRPKRAPKRAHRRIAAGIIASQYVTYILSRQSLQQQQQQQAAATITTTKDKMRAGSPSASPTSIAADREEAMLLSCLASDGDTHTNEYCSVHYSVLVLVRTLTVASAGSGSRNIVMNTVIIPFYPPKARNFNSSLCL
jgi:hypothetical protein